MPRRSSTFKPETLVRPVIRRLQAYVPGEQPKIKGLVKLNTNENPYGPAPEVLEALRSATDGRLRLYPNPTAERLRIKLAQFHQCAPENIIVGNGSDELLALASRAFVEPLTGLTQYALQCAASKADRPLLRRAAFGRTGARGVLTPSRYAVQYLDPSYSLYPVLAGMHGAWPRAVPLPPDFSVPSVAALEESGWDSRAALSYITTPHAPSGREVSRALLASLSRSQNGVLVLDEAYVDFADADALQLALEHPNVLVSRTFSKAYSLCFLRVGYMVGHPALISALDKIRDSYNVNGLAQVAAEATLGALPYYKKNFARIIRSREYLANALNELDFQVLPSQTNFLLAAPPRLSAESWLARLREEKILVRWFSAPAIRDYLRITVGSEDQIEELLRAVKTILARG